MSANGTLLPRTSVQRLAIDVAMQIFREMGYVPWFQLTEVNVRDNVTVALTAYRDQSIVERIARSNAGLAVSLKGDYVLVETWMQRIAIEVVIRLIRDIVGIEPVNREPDGSWIFLGREIRNQEHLKNVKLERGTLIDARVELVDLWASANGERVKVVDGNYSYECGVEENTTDKLIREAVRRRRLLRLSA